MIFKEKIMLANCDSVRQLDIDEIKKRFLLALTFSEGVILSPNIIVDNLGFEDVLSMKSVQKYLNEEGAGKFVIRGFNLSSYASMLEYFESREDNFIISSLQGSPRKGDLKSDQLKSHLNRLRKIDYLLKEISPKYVDVKLENDSLNNEIGKRLVDDNVWQHYFNGEEHYYEFLDETKTFRSRSDWYNYLKYDFHKLIPSSSYISKFRFEIVDPSYNYIYTGKCDAFVQDNIRYLSGIPEELLKTGLTIRSYKDEVRIAKEAFDKFQLISSMGSSEIVEVFTEKAIEYLEDKVTDKGLEILTRKNWFGLYPKLREYIGLEIK